MVIEVPIEQIIAPQVFDEEESSPDIDEFASSEPEDKAIDYQNTNQSTGFKQGLVIAIADKNVNFSKRPGYLTLDLDRREEPQTAHSEYIEDKDDFDHPANQYLI